MAALPPTLEANKSILSQQELALANKLLADGQGHLFASWAAAGTNDAEKHEFFAQVAQVETSYPGGVTQYTSNARKLLEDSRLGKNPFEGFEARVPAGEQLEYGTGAEFAEFERIGLPEIRHAAFVLVAGGLGERLGYSGIKVALTSESMTGACFLKQYVESIMQLSRASNEAANDAASTRMAELAIMTSGDTHSRTVALLEANGYWGMPRDKLTIVRQEKVPCLLDNEAHLALEPGQPYSLQTKPHGHGDVHMLLHQSGLLARWLAEGRKWVLFFQDTNALFFKAVPSALGVSISRKFEVNSLAVPRRPKEAIGGICELVNTATGSRMTINVEYNQLEPLLRSTPAFAANGDTADPKTGYSPFPGNINQLVMALEPYARTLQKTGGLTPEFVNPKYSDAAKTKFASTSRLECMMQDYPRSLSADARVGFTVLDVWAAFSPVKNNPKDATAKAKAGQPPASGASGELDQYGANTRILGMAGVHFVGEPQKAVFHGVEFNLPPRVFWTAGWAPTLAVLRSKVGSVEISTRSVLIIEGADVQLRNLKLDGTLWIRAPPGASVVIDGLVVKNKGWQLTPVDIENKSLPEDTRVRGFCVTKAEEKLLAFSAPGKYVINA
jgi:UDP-sugar pyrophosphorylase